jgi:hypothetical protein
MHASRHSRLSDRRWIVITAGVVIPISLAVFYFVQAGSFKVCIPTTEATAIAVAEKTIAALDSIVDLAIKLSTTLVGLGAAVLLGLNFRLQLGAPIRSIILVATICFLQSALYAVFWRLGIAGLWLNDCPTLVAEPMLKYRYFAHFGFFLSGLFTLGYLSRLLR